MFVLPTACILFGCLSNLPLDRVTFNKNFIGVEIHSVESHKTKYYEKGKACYIDGVFYQSCSPSL